MKIFKEHELTAKGKLLPCEEFLPFRDISYTNKPVIQDEYHDDIIKNAEIALDTEYPQLPASVYMQFKRNGNRSVYEGIYFKRRSMICALMLGEYIERKNRFIDKLLDGVWMLLEESTWVIPAHNKSRKDMVCPLTYAWGETVDNIDLFSAETGSLLAWVYYLTQDILDIQTPLVCERMLYELDRRIITPFLKYDNMGWMGLNGESVNNWNPWILSNVLTVCALCVSDKTQREIITDRAMIMLDNFIGGYHSDGGCDEGPGYWSVAGASYFDCLELLYDMSGGKIDCFGNELVRRVGEYIENVHISSNYFINFADCAPILKPNYMMISRYGRRTNSLSLEAFGKSGLKHNKNKVTPFYTLFYRGIKGLCETVNVDYNDYKAPKRMWMDGINVMAVRSGELYLAMKGGHNAESHNHNDVGSFIVYIDGKPLFCDAGVATYTAETFGKNRYKLWTMQSQYHNTLTINGYMQEAGVQYRAENPVYNSETGSLTLDLKKAYKSDAKINHYLRSGEISDGKIIITDDISLDGTGDIVFNLLSVAKPDITKKGYLEFNDAIVHYDGSLEVDIEEIILDDRKLITDWKQECMYRINLSKSGFVNEIFIMTIKSK